MMMTQRTKNLKTWDGILTALIYSIWLICLLAIIIYGFSIKDPTSDNPNGVGKQIIEVLYPSCIAYIVAIVLYIFVTKKIKTMGWMASVILASYFISDMAMYIVFGIWILDEYLLTPLQKSLHNKYIINKEIDLRE
jgi:hypothetical protein